VEREPWTGRKSAASDKVATPEGVVTGSPCSGSPGSSSISSRPGAHQHSRRRLLPLQRRAHTRGESTAASFASEIGSFRGEGRS
jgi:hypothetical protein